jgi:PAS domain S-box-containing protein
MSSVSRVPAAGPAIPPGIGTTTAVLVAGAVLLLTLGATWLAWERVGDYDARVLRAEIDYRARDVERRIARRMNAYEHVLRGAAGLFANSEGVSRTEFRDYVAALQLQEHYPGIQGLGFALVVPAHDVARHTRLVQQDGFREYAIQPPGPRDPYTSIVFLEPFEGRNLRAFGYDMFSEPVRREAMERALAEGRPALSGKVTLVQETGVDVQLGVLLYLPVFRKGAIGPGPADVSQRVLGWVYMPFRMNDLAVAVLGERGPDVATAIYDGDEPTSAGLLYDSEKASGGRTPALDHLLARRTFLLAGRPWTVVLQSLPPLEGRFATRARPVVAFGGLALSLLLAGLVWTLASGQGRAVRIARGMNFELRKAGEALRESETRLHLAVRGADLGIWDWDIPSGRVTFNDRWAEMLGYPLGEIEPNVSSWERLIHPDDASRVRPVLEAHLRGETPFYTAEHRLRHKDGHWVWVLDSGLVVDRTPDGSPLRAAGTHLDITERRQAEVDLAEVHEQLRRHVTNTPLAVVEWDGEYRVTRFSGRAEEMFGWAAGEVLGKRIDEVPWVPEADWPLVRAVMDDMSGGTRANNVSRNHNRRKDGSIIYCEWYNSSFRGDDGRLASVFSLVQDVTARTAAESALHASEARYRGLFDSLMDGFVRVDMDGVILESNEAYRKMLGYSAEELAGRTYQDLTPERWRPVEARITQEQTLLRGYSDLFEKEYRRKDGTVFPVELRSFLQREAGRPVAMWAIVRDVTEARALQTQLALTSRLAAMGTLVAGVAHEINNPLAAALSDQDLAVRAVRDLRDRLRGSGPLDRGAEVHQLDEVVEELGEAQEAGRRIERIVKDLKVFARPKQKDARERVRLMDVVDLAMRWLPVAIDQTATVTVENGGAPEVVATAGQITQVVVNLVTNAAKATPEGARGAIVIRVGPGTPGMARVEVIDHGHGIDPAVLPRIFEPFFTTGDVGEGTGLGLSICHAIVTSHGGTLTVRSEAGKGSTFRVELPAVTEEA